MEFIYELIFTIAVAYILGLIFNKHFKFKDKVKHWMSPIRSHALKMLIALVSSMIVYIFFKHIIINLIPDINDTVIYIKERVSMGILIFFLLSTMPFLDNKSEYQRKKEHNKINK